MPVDFSRIEPSTKNAQNKTARSSLPRRHALFLATCRLAPAAKRHVDKVDADPRVAPIKRIYEVLNKSPISRRGKEKKRQHQPRTDEPTQNESDVAVRAPHAPVCAA